MHPQRTARRTHGTGSLLVKNGAYYGKWRVNGRQVLRKLGPVRPAGTRDGLTKTQAEAQLRKLMADVAAPVAERVTVQDAAERLLEHLEAMGRKPSTIRAYRCLLRAQIGPRIGDRPVARVTTEDVERLIAALRRDGLSVKTVMNMLGFLHSIMEYSVRRGWTNTNPCRRVDRPRSDTAGSKEIHFLDGPEIEALLQAVPDDDYGRVYRAVYLCAVMTGMRRGELIALRWQDVDWPAQRIRVRRNYVNGRFGTPKSRRGSRSIPLADRLGGELDRLYQQTAYQADDDLVFANPHTGRPLDGNALLRSFQRTLTSAGVRRVRFHDLRHTFGTRMAAAGVPMRTLQEWLGHRDFATTLIYADYAPGAHEVDLVNGAFNSADTNPDTSLSTTQTNSNQQQPVNTRDSASINGL